MSVDCCLGKGGHHNRLAQGHGLFLTLGSDHLYLKQTGCSFSISGDLLRQLCIYIIQCFLKFCIFRTVFFVDDRITRHSICQQKYCIISRSISIHRHHIVGIFHIIGQCFLQKLLGDCCIGGHKSKHGTHIRMDHAGAFTHTADGHGLTANLNLHTHIFRFGIGGHDSFCCIKTCLFGILFSLCQQFHTRCDPIHGKLHTDHSGGCYQHGTLRYIQGFRCRLSGLLTISVSFRTCAGIGDTGIDDHCLCGFRMIDHFLIPFDRSCFYHIGSKCSRCHTGNLTVHQRHILTVLIFDAGFY